MALKTTGFLPTLSEGGPLEWASESARTDELFSSTTITSHSPSSFPETTPDICLLLGLQTHIDIYEDI